jgi:hypothetical protein
MNPQVKEAWLVALRSGDFQQGKFQLQSPEHKFCCLGVLCELALAAGVVQRIQPADRAFQYGNNDDVEGIRQASVLPRSVVRWAGLQSQDPAVGDYPLSHHNDTLSKNFDEIADLIARHL